MNEIKGDVQRMVKRRKDSGFTLIELMIVIAVIGILAVVLVPKMTNVKASANSAGVITNAKSVEAYVTANIDKWDRQGVSNTASTDISGTFTDPSKDKLTNPYPSGNAAISVGPTPGGAQGLVTVTVPTSLASGITITGYGQSASDIVYTQIIKPN